MPDEIDVERRERPMAPRINLLQDRHVWLKVRCVRVQLSDAPEVPATPVRVVTDFDVRNDLRAETRFPDGHAQPVIALVRFEPVSTQPSAPLRELHAIQQDQRVRVKGLVEEARPRQENRLMRRHDRQRSFYSDPGSVIPFSTLLMNPLTTCPVTSIRCSRLASEPPNPPRSRLVQSVVRCARTRKPSAVLIHCP